MRCKTKSLVVCTSGAAAVEYLTTVGGALVIGWGLYAFATQAKSKVTAQGNALSQVEDTVPTGSNNAGQGRTLLAGVPNIPGLGGVDTSNMTDEEFRQHAHQTLQQLSPPNPTGTTIGAPDPNNPGGVRVRIENENVRRQTARDTRGVIVGDEVIMRNDRATAQRATQSLNDQGYPIIPSDNATDDFRHGVRDISVNGIGNALGTLLGRPQPRPIAPIRGQR